MKNNNDTLLEIIKSRKTIRSYKSTKIPQQTIEKMLEAGRWAPSAHNIQPWKFVVISDAAIIKDVYGIMKEKEKSLFAGFNIVMRETAKCLETSPLLVAIYGTGAVQNKFSRLDEPYSSIGKLYEIQSVSFAIHGMILYAHSVGVGSACLGVALFCEKEINSLLNQKGNLIALLSFGFPNQDNISQSRKSIEEITVFI